MVKEYIVTEAQLVRCFDLWMEDYINVPRNFKIKGQEGSNYGKASAKYMVELIEQTEGLNAN